VVGKVEGTSCSAFVVVISSLVVATSVSFRLKMREGYVDGIKELIIVVRTSRVFSTGANEGNETTGFSVPSGVGRKVEDEIEGATVGLYEHTTDISIVGETVGSAQICIRRRFSSQPST